jgi:DNA helicase-2/ATP-dependent DNA helicase PcrA
MFDFKDFLKKDLNTQQRKAVRQKHGAMIVVAGAGSGKTRVITARMAHLILEEQINPPSILALTFTNKAAGEMKERLMRFLSSVNQQNGLPFVGTFHSYCLLLLRSNPSLLPFSNFTIIDEDDKRALLKKIIKKNSLEKQISATNMSYQVSKMKNQVEVNRTEEFCRNPIFKEIFLAYESEKSAAHSFDFDDLLLTALKIFKEKKEFKKKFQSRIKHILVDEYQDTNSVQHELLKEMGLDKDKNFALDSLCAVGDEDQSIYSWRGAVVTNMLSFKKDFKPVKTIKIEQNYRSVQPILQAANYVIEHNKQRHPKKLWSEKKARNRILALTCQSGYHEAETIANYIKSLPKKHSFSSLAILYRTHFQSRSIEESLMRGSIPYIIIGGIRFYERKEIKDLFAYLRLFVNKFDRTSLFRIINRPARGLGAKFEELLYEEWNKNPFFDFKQILQYLLDDPQYKLTGNKTKSIKKFLEIFEKLDKKELPSILLSKIIEQIDYFSYLKKSHDQHEAETKIENVQELARSIEKFDNLETFLHEVALLQEKIESEEEGSDQVQMMTLHAAKGLEFETVIVTGLEEGLLPSGKSMHSDDELEEERRLFYVGMTRAKERLVLTRSVYRNSYGQILDQVISRFLPEIPSRLIEHIDLTEIHPAKIKTMISQWLGSKITQPVTTFSTSATYRPAKSTIKPKLSIKKPKWKRNQVVLHKKFGMGVVKKIEQVSDDKYHLTIFFKSGTRRILSKFVQPV